MSVDCSRFTFNAWNDFLGVTMQQGRVQLDSDWNELVSEFARRLQAGTLDIVGGAVVPRVTADAFHIEAKGNKLTIGLGRIYVDGLLAENHGDMPLEWDPVLAELKGNKPILYDTQPYYPNPDPLPSGNKGRHLVYLDVWQREVTYLQKPELVEKAVGVDTTARVQTVWQVKILPKVGDVTCDSVEELDNWQKIKIPSAARLSTDTVTVSSEKNPCSVQPRGGYLGLENQLYRVEIHKGGEVGKATFKWSRDNATVASRISKIPSLNTLIVDSIGRDEVLRFKPGDWVEITDDWLELHGEPGELRRIKLDGGVDEATRTITLDKELTANKFLIDPIDSEGNIIKQKKPLRNTRIRRWDQQGQVRLADGTIHDLDVEGNSGEIPITQLDRWILLENGIRVKFDLVPADGYFKAGDYWVFAARTAVAVDPIEKLIQAPPRGIHHHYAKLALVAFPDPVTDCRTLWPSEITDKSCDCTVCISADAHNAGIGTLQHAIDYVKTNGGGTVCLEPGTYWLAEPLFIDGANSIKVHGQGRNTILKATNSKQVVSIENSVGVTIENLSVVGSASGKDDTNIVVVKNTVNADLERLVILGHSESGARNAAVTAVALSGYLLGLRVRNCMLVADFGIRSEKSGYLLTDSLNIEENLIKCRRHGLNLERTSVQHGVTCISRNLVLGCDEVGISNTGGVMRGSSLEVSNNVLQIIGDGIHIGTNGTRIQDNVISPVGKRRGMNGITLVSGLDSSGIDHCQVFRNKILDIGGNGIVIQTRLSSAMIKHNIIDGVSGGAIIMEKGGSADYMSIENNQIINAGPRINEKQTSFYSAIILIAVERVDITNNLFQFVAREAVISKEHFCFCIQTAAVSDLAIKSNRFHGIGPIGNFLGAVAAIKLMQPFLRASISGNTITRGAETDDRLDLAKWQAIVTLSLNDEQPNVAPNLFFAALEQNNIALLTASHLHVVGQYASVLSIQENNIEGTQSSRPVVEVGGVDTCILSSNHCRRISEQDDPFVVISSICVNASNNRLEGLEKRPTLNINSDRDRLAILGNITSGDIQVQGGSIPDPWKALNVLLLS